MGTASGSAPHCCSTGSYWETNKEGETQGMSRSHSDRRLANNTLNTLNVCSVSWWWIISERYTALTVSLSPSEPLLDSELKCRGEHTQPRSSGVCCDQMTAAEGSRRRKEERNERRVWEIIIYKESAHILNGLEQPGTILHFGGTKMHRVLSQPMIPVWKDNLLREFYRCLVRRDDIIWIFWFTSKTPKSYFPIQLLITSNFLLKS